MVNNLTAPRWTEEELNTLQDIASKSSTSQAALQTLEKLLPNRSKDAIRKKLKTLDPPVNEELILALRILIALKINTAENLIQIFSVTNPADIKLITSPITKELLRRLVDNGDTSVEILATKYNLSPEEVTARIYG